MERANPVFAPIIFLTFTISVGFIMVSFMLSLIIEGFTTVRNDLAGRTILSAYFAQLIKLTLFFEFVYFEVIIDWLPIRYSYSCTMTVG